MPRLDALSKYWLKHPPLHIMVQGYLGIKPKEPEPEIESLEQQEFVPATKLSESEFNALLVSKGIPIPK